MRRSRSRRSARAWSWMGEGRSSLRSDGLNDLLGTGSRSMEIARHVGSFSRFMLFSSLASRLDRRIILSAAFASRRNPPPKQAALPTQLSFAPACSTQIRTRLLVAAAFPEFLQPREAHHRLMGNTPTALLLELRKPAHQESFLTFPSRTVGCAGLDRAFCPEPFPRRGCSTLALPVAVATRLLPPRTEATAAILLKALLT